MDDLRTRLEHLSGRIEDRPDAFVRLERRRRARSRARRLAAGSLAVAIAVVGTATVYSTSTSPAPPRRPAATDDESSPEPVDETYIPALWPEHDAEQLRAAQEAVDAGDATLEWRLDPEETAVRFVRSVLGWTDADELVRHNGVEAPSGVVTVDVFTVPASCDEQSCDVVHDVIVQLLRLGDQDGIWSVISAESPSFNMQFRIGEAVRVGEDLEVISGHGAGTEIAVGVNVFEPCSGFRGGTEVVDDYRVIVPVRGVEEGCLAYVYALTPAGRDDVGRTLFADASEPSRAIDEIAVAPVFIGVPDGSGSVSEIPQPEEA